MASLASSLRASSRGALLLGFAVVLVACASGPKEVRTPEEARLTENPTMLEPRTKGEKAVLASFDRNFAAYDFESEGESFSVGPVYEAASGEPCRLVRGRTEFVACRDSERWLMAPSVLPSPSEGP